MIQLSVRVPCVSQTRYASFALAVPLYRVFEYAIDPDDRPLPGTRYRLPFSGGFKTGILLEQSDSSGFDPARIKSVQERLDPAPVLDGHMLALARWLAEYYLQPLGEVLFLCLPTYLRRARAYESTRVRRWRLRENDVDAIAALERRSPRQHEICIALAQAPDGIDAAGLRAINPNWRAAVKALVDKGLVAWQWDEPVPQPLRATELPALSDEQQPILERLAQRRQRFGVHLLDGITGSGKTEIYLRLIADCIAAERQVIYLVPEIGLTSQLIERVRSRFGDCFSLSHSALTDAARFRAWDRFRRGETRIMLGTRSSLFAQSDRLGLIIVDEEHDHSYRQEDGVRYHARDVAIKRAQMLDVPVVLGSATPALESIANCERDNWFRYRLDHRPTSYPPPALQLVDVRNSRYESGCSAPVLARLEHHLQQGGQVLIYLNRRGYAPLVMCHECGWQAHCQNCDARLTLHQSLHSLLCHHCGFSQTEPRQCPECGHSEIKHYGVGTEQLEQALRQRFAEVPIVRIDRDVAATREAMKNRLEQLRSGTPCILIGTQMIAKGHDYPAITLSVILDADQALFSAAYRASERLAQTLYQVSGRAGRGDRPGEALVQTRFPEHPQMQSFLRQDYRQIARNLLDERRALGFPPFARVVIFRADALELKAALEKLEQVQALLSTRREYSGIQCIGPLPALMTRRIGRYRAQLSLVAQDHRCLRALLRAAMPEIEQLPSSAKVNWTIDVDALDL